MNTTIRAHHRLRVTLAFALAALFCAPALAQDDAKQRKIYELMDVLGFKRELEKLTTPDGLADLTAKFTGKPPAAMSEQQRNADAAFNQKYLMPMMAKFDTQKMMQVWAEAYGRSMTEADVDAALEYHKSPVGQKDIAAQRLAAEAYTAMSMAELGAASREMAEKMRKEMESITTDALRGVDKPKN